MACHSQNYGILFGSIKINKNGKIKIFGKLDKDEMRCLQAV